LAGHRVRSAVNDWHATCIEGVNTPDFTMSLASITRLPDRSADSMRTTEAQDRVLDGSEPARRRKRVLVAGGIAALLLLLLVAWWLRGWATSDTSISRERVRIAAVTRGEFTSDLSAQATIVAAVSPTLYAPAPGTVTLVKRAGDGVRKGDVLATVDSPELRNEFERERATLDSLSLDLRRQEIEIRRKMLESQQSSDLAGVDITAAEREFKRAQWAWDQRVISERDYLAAQDELDAAKLKHAHAVQTAGLEKDGLSFELQTRRLQRERQQLLVADLERRVGDLEMRSPVDGMVGSVAVIQKEAVQRDAPIVTVVDLSAFEIEFRVSETYASQLAIGMPAEIKYNAAVYGGEVTAVSPEVKSNEVTGRVRFVGRPPAGLRQNQRVSIRIVMDQRSNVLMVERGAFYEAGAGRYAYVVEDDVAERRPITTGAVSVRNVEILGGLEVGDEIVISDTDVFTDANRVRLID
jgi:HlyD family secretion protein